MKILFVTASPIEYSSSANMRNIALINGLAKLGHEIYLLTSEADENNKLYQKKYNVLFKGIYKIPLGRIHKKFADSKRSNKLIIHIKSILYSTLNKFSLYDPRRNLINRIVKINESFDIVISSSDPKSSHLLAEKIIFSQNVKCNKWVQYWGDPFASDINNSFLLPKFLLRQEEERLLKLADKIVYVSPFTLKTQKEYYKSVRSKMVFLPIPFINPIIYANSKNDEFKIGYFGDFYSKDRNISQLLRAVQIMNINLKIYGNSNIKIKPNEYISISCRESFEKIIEAQSKCSLLICLCNKKGTQIPGKIYHYAATNKPILIILDGKEKESMRTFFDSFKRFYICDNDVNSILNILTKIKNERHKFTPLVQLESENIAKEFIESLGI